MSWTVLNTYLLVGVIERKKTNLTKCLYFLPGIYFCIFQHYSHQIASHIGVISKTAVLIAYRSVCSHVKCETFTCMVSYPQLPISCLSVPSAPPLSFPCWIARADLLVVASPTSQEFSLKSELHSLLFCNPSVTRTRLWKCPGHIRHFWLCWPSLSPWHVSMIETLCDWGQRSPGGVRQGFSRCGVGQQNRIVWNMAAGWISAWCNDACFFAFCSGADWMYRWFIFECILDRYWNNCSNVRCQSTLSAWLLQCPMRLTVHLCLMISQTPRQLAHKVITAARSSSSQLPQNFIFQCSHLHAVHPRCNEENLHARGGRVQLFQTAD